MVTQPYQLYVERKDQTKNMARFYAMSIEPTLFGELCLIRRWGRIGSRGQTMAHHFDRDEDAVHLFLDLTRQKRARGYTPISANFSEFDSPTPSFKTSSGKRRS